MSKGLETATQNIHPLVFRLIALALIISVTTVGVFSIYWLWERVIPLYGRIYRNAPVVEVPYLAFALLMAPPAVLIAVIGSSFALCTGKKFDPPNNSFLHRFQSLMIYLSVKVITYVVPAIIVITTILLLMRDYTPCSKLRISGSAWQLFWVNDERVCFKPTRYINDNWPCKMVGDQEYCIQVDGR
ncbi:MULTISPECIES: hypothetical protein [Pseudomonas syringae group]|uniref:hypothetical protein n=1 Tax=Pseudomonas syringae group TaxID=136849 RepID=UPI000BB5F57D|nr:MULTISPECIES: hypothetical protein [Pseudomonas syringae group]MCZ0950259.1 hypothetical protein [Pseudomonas syringae pv. tomato]NAO27754.1 hypothetical protein [Pseudomonas syringae pv. dysoxyli]PBP29908.1 hypothetical protein CCL12_26490 [Pseudomonas syringae]PBP87492.1 hypothetical protein CCL20_13225 [Pseudomonas syringae]